MLPIEAVEKNGGFALCSLHLLVPNSGCCSQWPCGLRYELSSLLQTLGS
jgi:hypothetical protein